MAGFISRSCQRSILIIRQERILEHSVRKLQLQNSSVNTNYLNIQSSSNTSTTQSLKTIAYNDFTFLKKQYYIKKSRNKNYEIRQYSSDYNNLQVESNLSFKDFQNVINISEKGDPDEINSIPLEAIDEDTDINDVIQRALKILNKRGNIDFKKNPQQQILLKTILSHQPEFHKYWLSVSIFHFRILYFG